MESLKICVKLTRLQSKTQADKNYLYQIKSFPYRVTNIFYQKKAPPDNMLNILRCFIFLLADNDEAVKLSAFFISQEMLLFRKNQIYLFSASSSSKKKKKKQKEKKKEDEEV